MAIKRGVSLYSYQQAQFLGQMDYRDMARELREGLDCDGIEIINEATVPGYPFPSREFWRIGTTPWPAMTLLLLPWTGSLIPCAFAIMS